MVDVVEWITEPTGIVTSIILILTLVSLIIGLIKPWIEKRKKTPSLIISTPSVTQPPSYGREGEVSFKINNPNQGKAIVTAMNIRVLDCGPSETLQMVELGAPLEVRKYKVQLNPNDKEYDLWAKTFGERHPPLSYEENEVEQIVIKISSIVGYWYLFVVCLKWNDAIKPDEHKTLETPELRIDFPPTVKELLGRKKMGEENTQPTPLMDASDFQSKRGEGGAGEG